MHFRTLTFCIVSIKNRTNFLDTLFLLKCTTLQRLAKKECDILAEQDLKAILVVCDLKLDQNKSIFAAVELCKKKYLMMYHGMYLILGPKINYTVPFNIPKN